MSFLPHPPALSAPPTVGGHRHQVAASGSENSARPSVSMAPGPASVFPFPADARAFSARIPDLASALYGLPYTNPQSVYPGFASIDPAIFQSNLNRINHKEIPSHWRPQVPQSPLLQHCDPNLASLMYQGGYGSLALNDGGRRKNATRETTATLKAWLNEHRKNPYPTKGEKIMLAIVSKMTLTQVSTWFANARRRLKKENRMTWSPRNRCGDERMSDEEDFEADGPGKNISAGKPNIGCHSEMDSHMDEVNRDIPGHSHQLKSEEGELEEEADSVTNDKLPSNLSYTNIHTQLFLRHLASLPPHLRPSDPIKYFQQQIQQHAATNRRAVSVPDMPATTVGRAGAEQYREKVRQFSMDAHDNYKVFRKTVARCSSESSPNSSLNRSPSPQANRFFNRDPPALERGSSYRMHSNHEFSMHPVRNNPGRTPSYEKHAMPSIINESDDQAVQEKKKYKIWSPVNISELQSKSPILSNNSDSEINQRQVINSARRNSVFTYDESFMNDSRFSPETHKQGISASPAASSSSEKTTSGSPDNVGKNIIEEYQRQLAYRNLTAKTQHALAATLAGLAENRRNGFQRNAFPNPDALALLQQQQRAHHNFVLSDIFHSNAYKLSKEDRNPSANEEDEEAVFSDVESNAPINLTKSKSPTPRREERPTFKLDEEDRKRIIPSIVAN